MQDDVESLRIEVERAEEAYIARHRQFRLAEGELKLATALRHDLHQRYARAVAENDALRAGRAC
ncbi:hypothetical protein I6F09_04900 [Bradyrhizobium sp. IC3195]|uniref:hypothetical protein n=1 Tax=Bradyrhizobium sp. IC3195 TaxID=2793804 RepID=UPI001CD4EA0F|nr:hypothetical protein [Bradyrhizobium sp. IC3195]MCA1467225.1 hypothetical protein [Bradyrhizobium sp. IC3195]